MRDAETYPPITRISYHGDTGCQDLAINEYEQVCAAWQARSLQYEGEGPDGELGMVSLENVQSIWRMTTEVRVAGMDRIHQQKMRYPD